MDINIPNFLIDSDGELSQKCRTLGLKDFQSVALHILNLPYRRNSSKDDLSLVFIEACGTCSTKHAALAQIAIENDFSNLKLICGIYKMNEANTTGVGKVLENSGLKYKNNRIDMTRTVEAEASAFDVLLVEKEIQPDEIGAVKVNFHRNFLDIWRKENELDFSLEELWTIREECIHALVVH